MTKILSKKEAIKRLEESDVDFVMFSEYDSIIGIGTEPQQIEKEKGKTMIAGSMSEDIPYSENMFVKTLKAKSGKSTANILMF